MAPPPSLAHAPKRRIPVAPPPRQHGVARRMVRLFRAYSRRYLNNDAAWDLSPSFRLVAAAAVLAPPFPTSAATSFAFWSIQES